MPACLSKFVRNRILIAEQLNKSKTRSQRLATYEAPKTGKHQASRYLRSLRALTPGQRDKPGAWFLACHNRIEHGGNPAKHVAVPKMICPASTM